MIIREARERDADGMCAVLNEIVEIGGTTAHEDPLDAEEMVETYISKKRVMFCHVAEDVAGRIAGFQVMVKTDSIPEGHGSIGSFARQSDPVKGVGRAMFAVTVEAARAAGLEAILAIIRADNVPGLGYYDAMGFTDHDVRRAVPLKDGTPMDRVVKIYPL